MTQPAAALLASFVLLAAAGAASAQTPRVEGNEPVVTVQGHGRIEARPDHAKFSAAVTTRGAALEAATKSHRERAERAAEALRNLNSSGIEIERSTFRLEEVRLPPPPGQPLRRDDMEYRAVTTFELKTRELDKIDAAITAVAATGLFEVRNLRFAIDDDSGALDRARRDAVADARRRAETYAQAAGMTLGEVVRISDTEIHSPREFAAAPMARTVQVIPPDSLTIAANVTITWRMIRGKH
jgi:uncharacterized protein YggE